MTSKSVASVIRLIRVTLEPGGDYFARLNPERAMRRIVRQANALGFTVQFDPIQTA